MDVRPQDEQRQHEIDAPRGPARVGEEDREHECEEQIRRDLGPVDRVRESGEKAGDGHDRRAPLGCAEAPGTCREDRKRGCIDNDDREQRHRPAAGHPEPIEREVGEPLLIHPHAAERERRQRVVVWNAVTGDQSTGDEAVPGVESDLLAKSSCAESGARAECEDHERVPLDGVACPCCSPVGPRDRERLVHGRVWTGELRDGRHRLHQTSKRIRRQPSKG